MEIVGAVVAGLAGEAVGGHVAGFFVTVFLVTVPVFIIIAAVIVVVIVFGVFIAVFIFDFFPVLILVLVRCSGGFELGETFGEAVEEAVGAGDLGLSLGEDVVEFVVLLGDEGSVLGALERGDGEGGAERTLRRVRDSSSEEVLAPAWAVRRMKTRRSWISCSREDGSRSARSAASALR